MVNIFKKYQLVLLVFVIFLSCKSNYDTKTEKLKNELYENYGIFSKKRQAVDYLLRNTQYHYAYNSESYKKYRKHLFDYKGFYTNQTSALQDSVWFGNEYDKASIEFTQHNEIVTKEFLISEIDAAFDAWERAPWRDSISFKMFKKYVLPYSVKGEPLFAYRKTLYDKYYHLVKDVNSPKEAFDIIYRYIRKNFKLADAEYPYSMDPLLIDRLMRGPCDMRTLYIVAVSRALCIPVSYDFVSFWANFSASGHSWAAYVGDGGRESYYFFNDDSVSHKRGYVDASFFVRTRSFDEDQLPYKIDSVKKISKIWRFTFEGNPAHSKYAGNERFVSITEDVSSVYEINGSVSATLDKSIEGDVYLCTFASTNGWVPICKANKKGKRVSAEAVGKDITYLFASIENGEVEPLTNPITLCHDGSQHQWNPDIVNTQTLLLRRKYMMRVTWVNRGFDVLGTTFEGSNDAEFSSSDVIHTITEPPLGIINVKVNAGQPYRYIRTKVPLNTSKGLSDISFWGINDQGQEVKPKGKLIFHNITADNAAKGVDGDYATNPNSTSNDFWIGYDLGVNNRFRISRISYCSWNDGNMVEPGDTYELFYYDMGWESLGRQTADTTILTYHDAPTNALFWLRNYTKGKEERIFTYDVSKQVWW